ncbi:MAG: hypothetical protein WDW36_005216 [Sanguina aurantia]
MCALYLLIDSVVSDLKAATLSYLTMLLRLAEDAACREQLESAGAVPALKLAMAWPHVQWPAKRSLHLLGHAEMEYQPFVRYSKALLATLLSQQGVPPAAFASRGIDAHLLLSLADEYMQGAMALDEVTVMKVRRIQRAHQMFNAMDSQDGKVDGCVRQLDVDLYLKNMANQRPPAASEIASRVFQELQVPNTEPICFMQFVHAYPWLSLELEAFMPMPQQTGSGGAGSGVPPTRASNGYKRQRLGENSANVAGTGAGVVGAIELE